METGIPARLTGPWGTVYFNDWKDVHGYGGTFMIQGLPGLDGATIRSPAESRPQRDGAILHTWYTGARDWQIKGVIVPDDIISRRQMEDLILGVTQSILRSDGTFYWTPSGGSVRSITARLHEPVDIVTEDSALKSFTIPLISDS